MNLLRLFPKTPKTSKYSPKKQIVLQFKMMIKIDFLMLEYKEP